MEEIRILQSSQMGYGNLSRESIEAGLKWKPHVIVGQGTSTDPGPGYLGSDEMYPYVGKINKKRDTGLALVTAKTNNIPFIVSLGSPAGADIHLEGMLRAVDEITRENGLKLRIAVISGEIPKEYLIKKLERGVRIRRLVEIPRLSEYLTPEDVIRSKRIVAQMGPEPIMKALDLDVDGVVTGRALDVGLHMAFPLKHGFDRGLVALMAKIIECGCMCAVPPRGDNIFAFLRRDHFLVRPPNPREKCTVASVAGHAFYERPDITRELNPGGYLDITDAEFEQYDERTVKVSGGKWVPMEYTIKLEGAAKIGYRTITIAGARDPMLVKDIDAFLKGIEQKAKDKFAGESFRLLFHVYGRDAVLGRAEPKLKATGHELGIVADVVAETEDLSQAICGYVRGQLLFAEYVGKTTTAGNVAVLTSPGDIKLKEAYVWNIWHALPLDDPCEPFPIKVIDFPRE